MSAFGTMYSDIRIFAAAYPGTIQYEYVFTEPIGDHTVAQTMLEQQVATLQSSCDSALFPEMALAGITAEPKITYAYYDADGSLIWSHTFEPTA